jgi:hypothetical protein
MQVVRIGLDLAKSVFEARGEDVVQPHHEAGSTSAGVTSDPDPANLLPSGGVHIRPHMAAPFQGPEAESIGQISPRTQQDHRTIEVIAVEHPAPLALAAGGDRTE